MRKDVVEIGGKVTLETGNVIVPIDSQALTVLEKPNSDFSSTYILGRLSMQITIRNKRET